MADYRIKHLSVRVPWHDNGWNGQVCLAPDRNHHCSVLPYVAKERALIREMKHGVPGAEFNSLGKADVPPCLKERSAFLSPNQHTVDVRMPYSVWSSHHKHILPSTVDLPPWGGVMVPFRWMKKEHAWSIGQELGLDVGEQFEPQEPSWLGETPWVQGRENQQALLDAFAEALKPTTSLVFFYAKRTPLVDYDSRFLVGAARLLRVGLISAYPSAPGAPSQALSSLIWERPFQHSLRRDQDGRYTGGVLLPYWKLLAEREGQASFTEYLAELPPDEGLWTQFSHASEHVTHQGAASALWALKKASEALEGQVDFDAAGATEWIDAELNNIWKCRGPYPGLGSALSAVDPTFNGTLFTYSLSGLLREKEDPWRASCAFLSGTKENAALAVPKSIRRKWQALAATQPQRLRTLELLARFDLSPEQALRVYANKQLSAEVLRNPYQLFEEDRRNDRPVSFWTVDSRLYSGPPGPPLHKDCELDPSDLKDPPRVRAALVEGLERAAANGDTVLGPEQLVELVAKLETASPVGIDAEDLELFSDDFKPYVYAKDNFFQLDRYLAYGDSIRAAVDVRIKNPPPSRSRDWETFIASQFKDAPKDEDEQRARKEKAGALNILASSRLAVLVGPAGTGKTSVIGMLLEAVPEWRNPVLLAPTGKARVRMQATTGRQGQTLAQFLLEYGRYDPKSQRYYPTRKSTAPGVQYIIVDEASMLTEDQFAALFDALEPNCRVIFVGDPQQLPPIGAGRPFVDLINFLCSMPQQPGYAELTIRRRQVDEQGRRDLELEDVQFAELFSGRPLPAGEDEIVARVRSGETMERLRFVQYKSQGELLALVKDSIVSRLPEAKNSETGFSLLLGAKLSSKGNPYFQCGGSAEAADSWQLLTPHRFINGGARALNQFIHDHFRTATVEFARDCHRGGFRPYRITRPMGSEQIVVGDKVICLTNGRRRIAGPQKVYGYAANGEIGVVIGESSGSPRFTPKNLEVELSTQAGVLYKFWKSEFDEEGTAMELAYAITVHKAQGSQFQDVFLVLPRRSAVLSREMLYTALTRQQQSVTVFHEGTLNDLLKFRSDERSEIKRRSTNLFRRPSPIAVLVNDSIEELPRRRFLEEKLIHRSARGEMLSSKNEVVIADALLDATARFGIRYVAEPEIDLAGQTRSPDFLIQDAHGQLWYWEHLGMLNDAAYRGRWERKLEQYRKAGIFPHEERSGGKLIITRAGLGGSIDSRAVRQTIEELWGRARSES